MIKKQDDGSWLLDVQPGGRGKKRYRKTFRTKLDAVTFERQLQSKVIENPFFELPKREKRTLKALIDLWYNRVGVVQASGLGFYQKLQTVADNMGNPVISGSMSNQFSVYRACRVNSGVSISTINRELASLKAVFSHLVKLGEWNTENPFKFVSLSPVQETKVRYLVQAEIDLLFQGLLEYKNPDLYLVALVCLKTGARWREAQRLTNSDIAPGRVTFSMTKGKKVRSVPVSDELYRCLKEALNKS